MRQWGNTINNIFPNKKIHLKQWNPTFHVLNTNSTCMKSSNIPVKENKINKTDMIYIKNQIFKLLRYYSPALQNTARTEATQNITHNMTSSSILLNGLHSL